MKKKTKIVATISDLKCEPDFLKTLVEEGVNVIRLNTAHMDEEKAMKVIHNIRSVSNSVAILIDTKGPEIRTSKTKTDLIVEEGDIVYLCNEEDKPSTGKYFSTSYSRIVEDVSLGSLILIDDGDMMLSVEEKNEKALVCKVKNSGFIKGMKSVNIPNAKINLPSLTEKDKRFIEFAIEQNLDFIAHSFVRRKDDVMEIKQMLEQAESKIKVIAKIENQEGVDNIDEILDEVYGVMVARGDLAIEIPAEKVPAVQTKLVNKCVESKKPVIIATQMLHSMISNPRPTRAEVTDVAHAIYSHADAIMLSGETAYGSYPVESVRTMSRIASEIESELDPKPSDMNLVRINNEITAVIAKSAVNSSAQLPIKALVLDTLSGRTARYISAFRGKYPVYAICYDQTVMRQLALSYGIETMFMPLASRRRTFMSRVMKLLTAENFICNEDLVIVIGGSFGPGNGPSFMEISKVSELKTKD